VRVSLPVRAVLVFGLLHLHLHVHHPFRGSPIGYAGLAAASAASWIGLPGPGEPVLIAAGVFAAKHKLDITSVILTAFLAAAVGGIVGWAIGVKAGRAVVVAPGPLRRLRRYAVARGDEVFTRVPVVAIILAPSWVAGIHRVRPLTYHVTNVMTAAVWAAGIGLGGYYLGPTVIDGVSDLGLATVIGLVTVTAAVVGAEFVRRRRRTRRDQAVTPDP
jgi:membrane protein DedA with SNARE-associated domain